MYIKVSKIRITTTFMAKKTFTKWLHNKTDSILNAPIGTLLTNHTKLNNSFDSLGSENSSTKVT